MKAMDLLLESPIDYTRRRKQPIDIMSKYYNDKKRFVSYTDLPKLGLNPRTDFESTPAGVYGYPLSYVLDRADRIGTTYNAVPFAGDRKYVIMFSVTGNVIDVSKHSFTKAEHSLLKSYINSQPTLKPHADEVYALTTRNESNTYLAYMAVQNLTDLHRRSGDTKHPTVILSNICRHLKWDALVDYGNGIIHPHEPYQCVVINPVTAKNVEIFDNKSLPSDIDEGQKALLDHANSLVTKFDNQSIIQNSDLLKKNFNKIRETFMDIFEIYESLEETIPPTKFRTHVWPSVDKSLSIVYRYYNRFDILALTRNIAPMIINARQRRIVRVREIL